MSALDMVTRARQAIGNVDQALYPDLYFLQSLNNHQRRIQLKYPWVQYCTTETVTTTAGTAEYQMAGTDVLVLENVVNTTQQYDLQQMDETDYDLWQRSLGYSGPPTHYMISSYSSAAAPTDAFKLLFYPTPDGVYSLIVRYSQRLPEIVLTPTPNYAVLPSQFDEVLISYAVADAWLRFNEFQKSAAWGAIATGAEAEAKAFTFRPTEVVSSVGWAVRAGVK
jgi:hypothetical protein